jgi:hypothetical protein
MFDLLYNYVRAIMILGNLNAERDLPWVAVGAPPLAGAKGRFVGGGFDVPADVRAPRTAEACRQRSRFPRMRFRHFDFIATNPRFTQKWQQSRNV